MQFYSENNFKPTLSDLDPSVEALLREAEELKVRGEFDRSISLLEQVIMNDPACGPAYEELGDNYLSMRDLHKGRKALEQAVKTNKNSANAHYLLGFLLSLQQEWFESVTELKQADQLYPNHPEILRCLGWSLYNNSRQNQGIAVLERSISLSPKDINIMCDLGVCYMNSGQMDEAKKRFQKVVDLAPESDQAEECRQFLHMIESQSHTDLSEATA